MRAAVFAVLFMVTDGSTAMDVLVRPPFDAASPALAYASSLVQSAVTKAGLTRDTPRVTVAIAAAGAMRPESFTIAPSEDRRTLMITAADARGAVRGLMWLADRISVEGKDAFAGRWQRTPAFRRRFLLDGASFRTPPGSPPEAALELDLRFTCNTHAHSFNTSGAAGNVYLDTIDPRLVDDVAAHRRSVDANRQALRQELDLIRSYGIDSYRDCSPFSDLGFIANRMIELYGGEVSEDGVTLSPALDKPWEIWAAMQEAYLAAFPDIAGIRSSMGDFSEQYQIWRAHGPRSAAIGPAGGMRRFVEYARDAVVRRHGRELIVSAWGNPPEEYPLNQPAALRRIFADVSPEDPISLLSNECEHDFYLNSPFNDNFAAIDIRRGIMFQVQREYQGQGDLPVYVGRRIREHLGRAAGYGATDLAAARLWWSRNLYNEGVCWTWWNMYAWQRATWEPDGDPWEWARDYSTIAFGRQGARELADALMLTEELAARLFTIPGFTGGKRDAYTLTHRNVITDGRHYWRRTPDPQGEGFAEHRLGGRLTELLLSVDATERLADTLFAKARVAKAAMGDTEKARAVMASFEHLHALVPVLTHYQRAILLWHGKDAPQLTPAMREEARGRCATECYATLAAFGEYRARHDMYRDGGMVPLVRSWLRALGAPLPPEIERPSEFGIPVAAGALLVDGTLRGWPAPAIVIDTSNSEVSGNAGDFRADVRLAWDSGALKVAVDAPGGWPATGIRAGRLYYSDSVSLSFDTDNDGREDAIYFLLIDGDSGEPRIHTLMRRMVFYSSNYEERGAEPPPDTGAAVKLVPTGSGRRWVAAIPVSMLDGYRPDSGVPLGLRVQVNVNAAPGPGAHRVAWPRNPVWRDAPPEWMAYGHR